MLFYTHAPTAPLPPPSYLQSITRAPHSPSQLHFHFHLHPKSFLGPRINVNTYTNTVPTIPTIRSQMFTEPDPVPDDENYGRILLRPCIAVVNKFGLVLIEQRPVYYTEYPLQWGFPGVRMRPREAPEAAIQRIIKLETGLVIHAKDLMPLTFTTESMYSEKATVVEALYLCLQWYGIPYGHRGRVYSWVDPMNVDTGYKLTPMATRQMKVVKAFLNTNRKKQNVLPPMAYTEDDPQQHSQHNPDKQSKTNVAKNSSETHLSSSLPNIEP